MKFAPSLLILAAATSIAAAAAPPRPDGAETATTMPAQATAAQLGGHYAVQGRNPDGTPYRGKAIVAVRGDGRYDFLWYIGGLQRGIGTLAGTTLTVDFGDTFPAVYELRTDGSLQGTWADGRASEELTPVGMLRT